MEERYMGENVMGIKAKIWLDHLMESATEDRGDVPGWVLVTVMTAGLVTGLWVVADEQLTTILSRAVNSVAK